MRNKQASVGIGSPIILFLPMATRRILQNNRLVWVDSNIDDQDDGSQQILKKLKNIVSHVDLFTQVDDCFQFLEHVKNEQVLIITSGSLGSDLLEQIHPIPHVHSIYIFCKNPERHQSWTHQWSKIRGIHNDIELVCEALSEAIKQSDKDLTPISFVTKSTIVEEESSIDPSFM